MESLYTPPFEKKVEKRRNVLIFSMVPTVVAGGIKVALLTTLMGLIAAVILQLFYNYIISKIDSLVNAMEDASITLVDILTAYKK